MGDEFTLKGIKKSKGWKKHFTLDLGATPYNWYESFVALGRYIFGVSKRNKGTAYYLPQKYTVDSDIKKEFTMHIVGDWLDLKGRDLEVNKDVKEYIQKGDYFLLNLEKLITDQPVWKKEKLNKPQIIEVMLDLFPPEKTIVTIANNHSGDDSKDFMYKTINRLTEKGFIVIGHADKPYVDIRDDFRIIAGSTWSNKIVDYVTCLDLARQQKKEGAYNLLILHGGYEVEIFPRPQIVSFNNHLLESFDSIFSHHSHTPMPICQGRDDNIDKIIAYSLGDFTCGYFHKWRNYGMLLRANYGKNKDNQWDIGSLEWNFTKCQKKRNKPYRVGFSKKYPSLRLKKYTYPKIQ